MGFPVIEWVPSTIRTASVEGEPTGSAPSQWAAVGTTSFNLKVFSQDANQPVVGAGFTRQLFFNTNVSAALAEVKIADLTKLAAVEAHGAGIWYLHCWMQCSAEATNFKVRLLLEGGAVEHVYTVASPDAGTWYEMHASGVAAMGTDDIECRIGATVAAGLHSVRAVGITAGRCIDFADGVVFDMPRHTEASQTTSRGGVVQTDWWSDRRTLQLRSHDLTYNQSLNCEDWWAHAREGGIWDFANDRVSRSKNWARDLTMSPGREPIQRPQGTERYRLLIDDAIASVSLQQ